MEDGSRRLQLVILPGFEIVEILLAPPADATQFNYAIIFKALALSDGNLRVHHPRH